MSESQCCHWWTKKQSAEEASRATYALVMPPPIPAEAHSPIRSNNNNNNSVLTPIWDELKAVFLWQNVICLVRYVIMLFYRVLLLHCMFFFFFWQHKGKILWRHQLVNPFGSFYFLYLFQIFICLPFVSMHKTNHSYSAHM